MDTASSGPVLVSALKTRGDCCFRMFEILCGGKPLKVVTSIVALDRVLVVGFMLGRWWMADKCKNHEFVNKPHLPHAFDREVHLSISTVRTWLQNSTTGRAVCDGVSPYPPEVRNRVVSLKVRAGFPSFGKKLFGS